jgi:pimeloyl-ACP methyl ester carboxylesterase
MPYFETGNLRLYYEDVGQGEPIISNHGLAEDGGYWRDTGVTAKLAERYRVVSIDMRGHGQTVLTGEPWGYDADTMGDDFDRLADHLGIDKFHLLSHATGGMTAARYAMTRSDRLLSLMLTDTGSATRPKMTGAVNLTEEEIQKMMEEARRQPIPRPSYEERKAGWRANPGPFTFKMEQLPGSDEMFDIMDGFYQRRLSPEALREFRFSFYSDPDPKVEDLKQIKCPTLILLGEFDIVFLGPSELMAWFIPDNRHVLMAGVGHMTAIEDPDGTIRELLDFLQTVAETGKANR